MSLNSKQSPQVDTESMASLNSRCEPNIGFVKVLDPLIEKLRRQRDPLDRSDSKLGPSMFGTPFKSNFDASSPKSSPFPSVEALSMKKARNTSFMALEDVKNSQFNINMQDQAVSGRDMTYNNLINGGVTPNLTV